jgi:nitronate monooxygenase
MSLPAILQNLRLPVIAAPLFIVSSPELVIAQCKAGVVGSFPALNARPQSLLAEWLDRIATELAEHTAKHSEAPAAPFAVNQIVHRSNPRLMEDLETCVKHRVPITICSLGAREDVYAAAHSYGGIALHDVINPMFARKAVEKGADGLIAVAAGAGGHAGTLSPFALVQEIRSFFDGPLALSGAIANGGAVLAARAMGADLAYVGSAFIATDEANAKPEYKRMIADCRAEDIVYTDFFSGVLGNYLKPSVRAAGFDPDKLPTEETKMDFSRETKAWRDIWSAGQGVGAVQGTVPVAELVARLDREYRAALARVAS